MDKSVAVYVLDSLSVAGVIHSRFPQEADQEISEESSAQ